MSLADPSALSAPSTSAGSPAGPGTDPQAGSTASRQQSRQESRARLRLQSIGWALTAGLAALGLGLPLGLEAALRAGGCGLLYGLLAFHLQRVDPDDSHLQAGLVGAVCGIHSLALPALAPWPLPGPLPAALVAVAPTVMMGLVRAWLPLIGAAVLLQGVQLLVRRVLPLTRL